VDGDDMENVRMKSDDGRERAKMRRRRGEDDQSVRGGPVAGGGGAQSPRPGLKPVGGGVFSVAPITTHRATPSALGGSGPVAVAEKPQGAPWRVSPSSLGL
jgi:hypothetical protein